MGPAKLPVSMGGLGLRAAEDHSPAAYVTFLLGSQSLREDMLHLADDSPINIKPAILALLSSKQEEKATTEALQGVSQSSQSTDRPPQP